MTTTLTLSRRLAPAGCALFLAVTLVSCGSSPPDDIIQKSGQPALVFVREPSQINNNKGAMASNVDEFFPGTDLFLLSPISPPAN